MQLDRVNAQAQPRADLETALRHARSLLANSPGLARSQAMEILRGVPESPEAMLVMAEADAAEGRFDAAAQGLALLIKLRPRWSVPWLVMASIALARGRRDESVACLRESLVRDPAQADVWRQLGDQLAGLGDVQGSELAYARQWQAARTDVELLSAADALSGNRLPEAEQRLRARLKKSPSDVSAMRMLAELAARLGRNEDAESLLLACLKLAPKFSAARQNLAMVLHRSNKPEQALIQIETLLAADPKNPAARNLKAVVLCRIGDYAPAIALYEALLAEYPGQARIWLSYGHALKTAGQGVRAIEAYRRSAELDPEFGEAWWSLANLKTFRFGPTDQAAMRTALARPALDPEQRSQFEFALAKACEDAADFSDSFAHYAEGNRLRHERVDYKQADLRRRVRRSLELFSAEFIASRAGWGDPSRAPIFVLGMPRAGSTLVEQILSSHPDVEGTMELPEVISLTGELRRSAVDGGSYHAALAELKPDEVRALGERYLQRTRVHRKTEAPYFIDKMPNNWLHVGLIHLMLPHARIVDVRRHPLACCFSNFKQYFARGQTFSYRLEDVGDYYRSYVAQMAHFDAILPGRVHRVVYESLVDDTENEVRRLLDYCGLRFDSACLRFFENERPVRTASSEQVRQPIYREGKDHWRNFEPWLGPLKQALGDVLEHYPEVPPALTGS